MLVLTGESNDVQCHPTQSWKDINLRFDLPRLLDIGRPNLPQLGWVYSNADSEMNERPHLECFLHIDFCKLSDLSSSKCRVLINVDDLASVQGSGEKSKGDGHG